jgi:predicted alpha/beta-fold hydrolase
MTADLYALIAMASRSNLARFVLLYVVYYFTRCVKRPDLFYNPKLESSVRRMEALRRSYYPLFFAPFGLAQTVLHLLRRPSLRSRIQLLLKTSQDGKIVLDLIESKDADRNALLVHGFNGSGDSSYMRGFTRHLQREGYRVFCFNARGIKSKLSNEIFFHIGWTADLKAATEFILSRYRGTLELYGFSMGASWVTKFFGEEKLDSRIVRGGAVCLPFDFSVIGSHFLKNPYTRFCNRLLAMNFIRYMRKNEDVFRMAGYDVHTLKKCRSVQQLDLLVTRKIFNISDVDEYYRIHSCVNYIGGIPVPFIIINSYDDPVVPSFSIDKAECVKNENVLLVVTHRGGHLGFLENSFDKTFAEEILLDFIKHF